MLDKPLTTVSWAPCAVLERALHTDFTGTSLPVKNKLDECSKAQLTQLNEEL